MTRNKFLRKVFKEMEQWFLHAASEGSLEADSNGLCEYLTTKPVRKTASFIWTGAALERAHPRVVEENFLRLGQGQP
jgi:hypothetical protein